MVRHFKPVRELVASKQPPPITPDALRFMKDLMRAKKFELEDEVEIVQKEKEKAN